MNENLVFLIAIGVTVALMAKKQDTRLDEIVVTSTRRGDPDFEGPFAIGRAPSELGLNGPGDA
jgi:hypothetical protein